jgi:hypothetical protein
LKNPCETCLIKAICMTPCDSLNKYCCEVLNSISIKTNSTLWYEIWMKEYEIRPAVLSLAIKIFRNSITLKTSMISLKEKKMTEFTEKEIRKIQREFSKKEQIESSCRIMGG